MRLHEMNDMGSDDGWLTPSQVAALLPSTSVDSVRRWVRSGALPAQVLPNGRYLVRRSDAEALLRPVVASAPSAGSPAEAAPAGQGMLSWPSPASPAEIRGA